MDDSQKTDGETASEQMKPAAKVEPVPSAAERRFALVASFEHAHKHNAPVTPQMIKDLRTEMLGEEVPATEDPSRQGSG